MGQDDPQHLPDDKANCFLDANRPCSANCMAFKTMGQDNDQLDDVQKHCVLLSSIERAGRGLIGVASVLANHAKRQKKRDDDEQRRAAHEPPPSPPKGASG